MATTQEDTQAENEADDSQEYTPDMDALVAERAKNYIEFRGEMMRAYDIASRIGSTPAYTREECNNLSEEREIEKTSKGQIIGHPMPPNGEVVVLEGNRDALLQIVDEFGTAGQYQQALTINTINELREFIKENVAIGEGHPLRTKKVFFGPRDVE